MSLYVFTAWRAEVVNSKFVLQTSIEIELKFETAGSIREVALKVIKLIAI